MSGYIGTQPVPQATQTRDVFTATSGQTTFATGGYTPNFVDVYLNGVKLVDGDDFTATNGSEVVLTTGATAGDTVEVLAYTAFSPANVYTIAEADAAFVKPNDSVTLGAVTATSFSGDGSGLTGLPAAVPSLGAVGSYAFLRYSSATTADFSEGSSYAGSSLCYTGGYSATSLGATMQYAGNNGSTPSGTWMAMGNSYHATASVQHFTMFVRIA